MLVASTPPAYDFFLRFGLVCSRAVGWLHQTDLVSFPRDALPIYISWVYSVIGLYRRELIRNSRNDVAKIPPRYGYFITFWPGVYRGRRLATPNRMIVVSPPPQTVDITWVYSLIGLFRRELIRNSRYVSCKYPPCL